MLVLIKRDCGIRQRLDATPIRTITQPLLEILHRRRREGASHPEQWAARPPG
jgi:hypothetical protein